MAKSTEKLYEFSYLASPDLDDAGLEALKNEIDTMAVKLGGSVREHLQTERRRLAYPVKKAQSAYLVSEQLVFTASAKEAFAKELGIRKDILRHIFVVLTEKFLKRLRERRVVELQTPKHEIAKEKSAILKRPTHVVPPREEKTADIAEIERKLDEILGREF
ncbi:MAG: 30S ribosomal protein S6 [bacterium]|nr:30S ribosomal protein S6 [bacterium]